MFGFRENWKSVPKWIRITTYSFLGVLGAAALGLLFGFVIMWLWNWLMPMLFNLKQITYWESIGIFILAKILFGSIGGSGGDSNQNKKDKPARAHDAVAGKADSSGVEMYDEWWESEGRQAFEEYTGKKQPSCAKGEKE